MANEDRFLQDKDGVVYFKPPGAMGPQDLIPVNDEQIGRITESGAEAFLRSIGNSINQVSTGLAAIAGSPEARQAFDQLSAAQGERAMGSPVASMLGSVAPDVALGAVTGGTGTLARRAAITGATEGLLGAARNPDDPLTGAAVQGTIGALAPGLGDAVGGAVSFATPRVSALTRRVANRMTGAVDDSRPLVIESAVANRVTS